MSSTRAEYAKFGFARSKFEKNAECRSLHELTYDESEIWAFALDRWKMNAIISV